MLQAPVSDQKTKPEASRSEVEREPERFQGLTGWGERSALCAGQGQHNSVAATQRTFGNQTALRMGQAQKQRSPAMKPIQGGLLQHKCACGNTASATGACGECQGKQEMTLQTKLRISEPGDVYEQEADRVADQVMAASAHSVVSGAPPRIQRFVGQTSGQTDIAPPSVDRVLASPGRLLGPALQKDMGQCFGHDFSRVRVHSDAAAEQSTQDVNAHAYTVGHNIVFGAGRFAPGTHEGRRLLVHELTHVVQQSGGGMRKVQRYEECGEPGNCPSRDPDEVRAAQADPMIVAGVSEPNGVLVANFSIGSSRIKADLATNPTFIEYTRQMMVRPQTRLEILGLSDCEGAETTNASLRTVRATALQDVLPANVRPQVMSVVAAPSNDCMQSNQTAYGRTLNRSAFLYEIGDVYTFEEEEVITATPGSLQGVTSPASTFFVRTDPNGERIGMLALQEMRVEIIRTHGTRIDNLWYQVRFRPDDLEIIRQRYAEYMRPQVARLQALEQEQPRLQEQHEQLERRPGMSFETQSQRSQLQQRIAQVTEDIDSIRVHQARLVNPYSDTTVWVGQAAFSQVAMQYDTFLQLIDTFDAQYASEPLRDRLTRLRQIGEDSSLEGDAVVGRGADIPGRITQSERPVDTSRWQLLLEAKQVIMPNMEVIDIHHFILGLDALALPFSLQSPQRRIYHRWDRVGLRGINVGESISAATWSGDVGGAVGDYVMHRSSDWERTNTSEDIPQRLNFYFSTRAPEMDLLGDIDAWGAFRQLPTTTEEQSRFMSLREILVEQYGGELQTAEEYEQGVQSGRNAGIVEFLCNYGFISPANLSRQIPAVSRVQDQVLTFGSAWYDARNSTLTRMFGHGANIDIDRRLSDASRDMTLIYLNWLETQARRYGVRSLECD